MKKRRVTVDDVARAAGVSLMTVSRAMNDREGIGEETRARILALAAEMGYYPSQIARSLATRQTATLGLVVPDVSNPFSRISPAGPRTRPTQTATASSCSTPPKM
jgi:DNA-binding LacI/PurR family transcriptional regulator